MFNLLFNFDPGILIPNFCTLCRQPLTPKRKSLCEACHKHLPWLGHKCRYCSLPLPHEHAEICGYCQKSPPAFQHSYCLFHYRYPIDKLITQLKFNGQLSQGRLLGQLLGEYIRDNLTGHDLPDAIIPMPLHPLRLKQRGFNQAAELARVSARILETPLAHHVCRRIKNTPPQLGLDAKTRRRNLRDAFWVDPDIRFSTVAIVDDVMTTGSSTRALANALVKSGVQRVELWCIARTAIDS